MMRCEREDEGEREGAYTHRGRRVRREGKAVKAVEQAVERRHLRNRGQGWGRVQL